MTTSPEELLCESPEWRRMGPVVPCVAAPDPRATEPLEEEPEAEPDTKVAEPEGEPLDAGAVRRCSAPVAFVALEPVVTEKAPPGVEPDEPGATTTSPPERAPEAPP